MKREDVGYCLSGGGVEGDDLCAVYFQDERVSGGEGCGDEYDDGFRRLSVGGCCGVGGC